MSRCTPAVILVVVLACAGCTSAIGLDDAFHLMKLARTAMEMMDFGDMIKLIPNDKLLNEDLIFLKTMERELIKRMGQISDQIQEYQNRVEDKVDTVLTQLLLHLPAQRRLDDSMKDLDFYIGQVQGLYKIFESYTDHPDKYERFTLLQFAKTCVSPALGDLPDVLKSLHRLVVPSEQRVYDRSILVLLAKLMKINSSKKLNKEAD